MTAPKVGDRVRVAELTGHVDSIAGAYAQLTLEAAGRHDVANLPLHALSVIHPPVKVWDVIETAEQLDALPYRTTVLDREGDAWQRHVRGWRCTTYGTYINDYAPFTVLYLPDGAA